MRALGLLLGRFLMFAAAGAALGLAWLSITGTAFAGDFYQGSLAPGADGGHTANLAVTPNKQFMASCNATVQYRVCSSAPCTATGNDAPIAGNAQIDLCAPTGYAMLSAYVDAGSATCLVYEVVPSTVCQIK